MKVMKHQKQKPTVPSADGDHPVTAVEVYSGALPNELQTPLTEPERETLEQYEGSIDKALQYGLEAGIALKAIRDERLYREQFKTFEEYCRKRWGLARPTAYQRIDAGESYQVLSAIADIQPPTNEYQTRVLAGLTAEDKVKVWTEAAKTAVDGKLTAKHIKATRTTLGLGKAKKPTHKPAGRTIEVDAVVVPMAEACGDPESVWANVKETLDRVRRAWPEDRQSDLHDRLRSYLRAAWPQKDSAAGLVITNAAKKAAARA